MFMGTNTTYARVWKVLKKEDKYMDLSISTSEKNGEEREYSSWIARVIGHAFNALKDVKENDSIAIKRWKLTRRPYEKDGNKQFTVNLVILDGEISNYDPSKNTATQSEPASAPKAKKEPTPTTNDSDDPWG